MQETRYLQSIVDLEKTAGLAQAQLAYQATLQRWPREFDCSDRSGNAAYQQHDLALAQHWFQLAASYHSDSPWRRIIMRKHC